MPTKARVHPKITRRVNLVNMVEYFKNLCSGILVERLREQNCAERIDSAILYTLEQGVVFNFTYSLTHNHC